MRQNELPRAQPATLRQTEVCDDEPLSVHDTLRLERRGARRYPLTGQVTTLAPTPTPATVDAGRAACGFANPDDNPEADNAPGHGPRIAALTIRDISETGLGGHSPRPMDVGAPITVFFPPHGPEHYSELIGTIVRCQPRHDGGYEIGVQLHRPLAA